LEKEFGVSSNTVRIELNKLSEVKLIEVVENLENRKFFDVLEKELVLALGHLAFVP
jgi:Fe2+ or Zn2+ uptake regulation protein